MVQVLGIFNSTSGLLASALGPVNFGPGSFTGHPSRSYSAKRSSAESNPSTIWIAVGVDPERERPGFSTMGGIMPDARVYDQKGKLLGKSIHNKGAREGDTGYIVVPQQAANYTLFSGNHDMSENFDNAICIAWATIHWQSEGSEYAWSGGWGHACEKHGAQWYYSGMTIPGSDNHSPDCLWVWHWEESQYPGYPPGTSERNPPVREFHVNWADVKVGEDDPRLNTSAQYMCDSRSFRLYKNHDPQELDLRWNEVYKRPDIGPPSHYTTSEKTTTKPSATELINRRQAHTEHTEHNDQEQHQQLTPSPGKPGRRRHRRGQSFLEKLSTTLVINDHEQQTAEGLCGSKGSLGPSFADSRNRVYCDMETKTLHPFCEGGSDGSL
ncbi:hypothetical protein INS49_003894 [Diaporthe citri]|uniref:uncharacterized protein n=1 Tax=Diaporthe citri TaxID=83186 RepID=UPI001C7FB189|nr:uncharacterized protein INS49_003894 [Diaporthe citri]KAG6354813.1 hypothetical protein INS49_003894 [Diaporthe citri]